MNLTNGAQLRVIAGAMTISFSRVLVKLAHLGPIAVGFYRTLIGGLVLLGLALLRRQALKPSRTALLLGLAAAFFFAMDLTLWHSSINYVGPGLATILTNFQVFITAAFGIIFLGEALSWQLAAAVPLALIGLALLVGQGWFELGSQYHLGVAAGLGATVAYAGYILFLRWTRTIRPKLGALSNMALVSLVSAGMLGLEVPVGSESFLIPDGQTLAVLIALGVTCQGLGWLWISENLPLMPVSKGGLILILQPTLSMIWDVLFFGRPLSLLEAAGACLALAAIYLGLTGKK